MNKAIIMGRLTADPEIIETTKHLVGKFSVAVPRIKSEEADFINCVCFDGTTEFVEKYITKGMKVAIVGHIQTGKYKNDAGKNVYTTDLIVENIEFAESKKAEKEPEEKAEKKSYRRK